MQVSIVPIPKLDNDILRNKNYRPIPFISQKSQQNSTQLKPRKYIKNYATCLRIYSKYARLKKNIIHYLKIQKNPTKPHMIISMQKKYV
jgi:hypothetical protein